MKRITLIVIAVELGLAAVGLLGGWVLGTPVLAGLRVDLLSIGVAAVATLPLIVLLAWALRTEVSFVARLREILDENVIPLFVGLTRTELMIVSIMAGIGEEFFFRAFLQGSLARLAGPAIALVLASAVFGLAHAVTLAYAIGAGLIGLYLGGLWLMTGNLFVPIAVHAGYDFVAITLILQMSRPRSEPESPSPGEAGTTPPPVN